MAPPKYAPGNDVHQFQNYPPQHHGPPGPYAQYYAPTPAPPYQQTTGTHVAGGPVAPATYAAASPPPTEYPTGNPVQTHATGGSNNPYYPPPPNPPAAVHVADTKV